MTKIRNETDVSKVGLEIRRYFNKLYILIFWLRHSCCWFCSCLLTIFEPAARTPENASAPYRLTNACISKGFCLSFSLLTTAMFAALIRDEDGLNRICTYEMDDLSFKKKFFDYSQTRIYSSDEEFADLTATANRKNQP